MLRPHTEVMQIADQWPLLTDETRTWLIDHNGEPLAPPVRTAVVRAAGGTLDSHWWAGDSVDGGSELTDTAIDWIEEQANGEAGA